MLEEIPYSLKDSLNKSSAGAFVALLWECAITFDTEVDLIWSKSNRSWLKWTFIFSRYFIIAVHIVSRSLEAEIISLHSLNISLLRAWYSGQVIVAALAASSLEVVLMARVYALYNQPRWLAILFVMFLLLELSVALTGLSLNLPGHDFIPVLVISYLPRSFAYFGLSSVCIQCVVLVLTMKKYAKSSLKAIPLVQLMVRDGTMAFIMLTIFSTTVVIYTLLNIAYAVTGYAWLLSAISCTTCRLIVNMQTVSTPQEIPGTSTTLIFTTILTDPMAFETITPADTRMGRRLSRNHM